MGTKIKAGAESDAPVRVQRFVRRLERVLLDAPAGIWLFAECNHLHVMRYGSDGNRVLNGTSMDSRAVLHTCKKNIEVDGGAW